MGPPMTPRGAPGAANVALPTGAPVTVDAEAGRFAADVVVEVLGLTPLPTPLDVVVVGTVVEGGRRVLGPDHPSGKDRGGRG